MFYGHLCNVSIFSPSPFNRQAQQQKRRHFQLRSQTLSWGKVGEPLDPRDITTNPQADMECTRQRGKFEGLSTSVLLFSSGNGKLFGTQPFLFFDLTYFLFKVSSQVPRTKWRLSTPSTSCTMWLTATLEKRYANFVCFLAPRAQSHPITQTTDRGPRRQGG